MGKIVCYRLTTGNGEKKKVFRYEQNNNIIRTPHLEYSVLFVSLHNCFVLKCTLKLKTFTHFFCCKFDVVTAPIRKTLHILAHCRIACHNNCAHMMRVSCRRVYNSKTQTMLSISFTKNTQRRSTHNDAVLSILALFVFVHSTKTLAFLLVIEQLWCLSSAPHALWSLLFCRKRFWMCKYLRFLSVCQLHAVWAAREDDGRTQYDVDDFWRHCVISILTDITNQIRRKVTTRITTPDAT